MTQSEHSKPQISLSLRLFVRSFSPSLSLSRFFVILSQTVFYECLAQITADLLSARRVRLYSVVNIFSSAVLRYSARRAVEAGQPTGPDAHFFSLACRVTRRGSVNNLPERTTHYSTLHLCASIFTHSNQQHSFSFSSSSSSSSFVGASKSFVAMFSIEIVTGKCMVCIVSPPRCAHSLSYLMRAGVR